MMESGNIDPSTTITLHYLDCSEPPFNKANQQFLKIRPHQIITLTETNNNYRAPSFFKNIKTIDCYCSKGNNSKIYNQLIDSSGLTPTLLWLDPCNLKNECLAFLIKHWQHNIDAKKNVAIGIPVPKNGSTQSDENQYNLWRMDATGPIYNQKLEEPTWYPSLARKTECLEEAAHALNPYDVFPLVEFPKIVIESGEISLTDHYSLLENFRTRTRNFIYFDVSSPSHAFKQFFNTLQALPKYGSSLIQPVITPGGTSLGYLTALLAGILSDSYFYTPKDEIPMGSNNEIQGIMIVEKCT